MLEVDPPNDKIRKAYPTENDRSIDLEIERIIVRPSHFASTITIPGYSKNAQAVIEDIGRLLGLIIYQLNATTSSRDKLPRKRKVIFDYHYSELEIAIQSLKDLGKIKRILIASQ